MFLCMQDKIRQVFDNLIQLEHPNIVKFHKYWTDTKGEKPRVREAIPIFHAVRHACLDNRTGRAGKYCQEMVFVWHVNCVFNFFSQNINISCSFD